MATSDQPAGEQQRPPDPTQLGADQGPATTSRDDAHDMSPVLADTDSASAQQDASSEAKTAQGSDFDQQRQQGAAPGGHYGDVGRSMGMGQTADTGDEDRGYDQSSQRGGVGSSGGREDLSDRQTDTDQNPYTGGYGGQAPDQPAASQSQHLGLNTPNPTEDE
ncbi:hypothetical protein FNT36_04625 [Hymenobacter setariae]|uniref:Uncharacterized protein n=1 Tax=Hymenobacter setariae TaxID=2594794 RepID=A0A558C3P7_9BACT|nr:hypothetical protein [Hymenobacter setariae]TVT43376.1 hypothetical protein FNT36_04625 [Hymenobacter setariae]